MFQMDCHVYMDPVKKPLPLKTMLYRFLISFLQARIMVCLMNKLICSGLYINL